MTRITPNFNFDGRCADAIALYEQAFHAQADYVLRYRDAQVPQAVFDREADHRTAVELEKECAVLLKNDGTLPLRRGAEDRRHRRRHGPVDDAAGIEKIYRPLNGHRHGGGRRRRERRAAP